MAAIRIKRGTRAQLNTAAGLSELAAGEPYLITDENAVAVGLTATTYQVYALETHAAQHLSAGADAIKLDDLAAPDDNTDLNVSSSAHGLHPKLGGSAEKTLMANGSEAAVARINVTDSTDDDFQVAIVATMPGTPDANTLYFVTT